MHKSPYRALDTGSPVGSATHRLIQVSTLPIELVEAEAPMYLRTNHKRLIFMANIQKEPLALIILPSVYLPVA
jgi:hypothetical protein